MSPAFNSTAAVKELLQDLDLYRLPVVPKEVCRRLGIEYREVPYEGIEGTLLVIGQHQLISVNARIKEASRKAFTCAHELGHYFYDLNDTAPTSFTCSSEDVDRSPALEPREIRANIFAAELLMPRNLFEPLVRGTPPSWELISKLADHCGTSLQATAQRYVELSPYGCWLAVLRSGKIHRYEKHPWTEAHLNTRRSILLPRNPSSKWQTAPAHVWMGSGRQTREKRLYQSFQPKNQYGETLALLWDRHRDFERFEFTLRGIGRRLGRYFHLS